MSKFTSKQKMILEAFAMISFLVILIAAIFMLCSFYICDSGHCEAFKRAEEEETEKEYMLKLLDSLFADGLWPLPYIASSIVSFICLGFLRLPRTVTNFWILFFVCFVVFYFMLIFISHHYIAPIKDKISEYIENTETNNSLATSDN